MGLTLTVLSETASKITLGWNPVPGAIGYRFQSATQAPKWSHTWDPSRSQVTFSKADWYKVEALGVEAAGEFPASQSMVPRYEISAGPITTRAGGWIHHLRDSVPAGQWGGKPVSELRTAVSWRWYGIYALELDGSWDDTISTYALPFDGHSVGGEPGWNTVSSMHIRIRSNRRLILQHEPHSPNEWFILTLERGRPYVIEADITLGRTDGTTPQPGDTRISVNGEELLHTGPVNNLARENGVNQTKMTVLEGIYGPSFPAPAVARFTAGLWGRTRDEALASVPRHSGDSLESGISYVTLEIGIWD